MTSDKASTADQNIFWRVLESWALYLVMGGIILGLALSYGYGGGDMTLSLGYYLTATGLLLMATRLKLKDLHAGESPHWALRWSSVLAALLVCVGTGITLGVF